MVLTPNQNQAFDTIDDNLQTIACAGSGKAGIRPDGWAKLPVAQRKDYAAARFVLRNKSDYLERLGPWPIIEGSRKPETGDSDLFHNSEFDDSYRRGFSVRGCKRYEEETKDLYPFNVIGTVVNQK
jgi:hypothetical protein